MTEGRHQDEASSNRFSASQIVQIAVFLLTLLLALALIIGERRLGELNEGEAQDVVLRGPES